MYYTGIDWDSVINIEYQGHSRSPKNLVQLNDNYNEELLIGEVGSLNLYKNVNTDFSFNVVNSYTVALLHSMGVNRVTLSHELTDNQIDDLVRAYKNRYNKNPNLELIIYGYQEMMVSKFKLLEMYKKTGNNFYLKDRYNKLYKVIEKNNLMYIYNSSPLNNIEKSKFYYDLGINSLRINILDDSEINNI